MLQFNRENRGIKRCLLRIVKFEVCAILLIVSFSFFFTSITTATSDANVQKNSANFYSVQTDHNLYLVSSNPLDDYYSISSITEVDEMLNSRDYFTSISSLNTNITIINPQSLPAVGGNWTVRFNTDGASDLTITSVNNTAFGRDIEFLELRCGENVLSSKLINGEVFVENYSCDETSYMVSRVLKTGKHDLEFKFGRAVEYAHNAVNDFKIQRGTMIIPAGSTTGTITNVTDFTQCTGACFIKHVSTRNSGMGRTSGGYLSSMGFKDFETYISNVDGLTGAGGSTTITFERNGNEENNRVTWEIWEYTGSTTPGSNLNQMEVLDIGVCTYGSGDLTCTDDAVAPTEDSDVVVFLTGHSSAEAGRNNGQRCWVTSEWDIATSKPIFTRGESGSACDVSYAVVEFSGTNWNVQRNTHEFTSDSTQDETITSVVDTSKAFIHTQQRNEFAGTDGNDADAIFQAGSVVQITGTDTLTYSLPQMTTHANGNWGPNMNAVTWVIWNTQVDGSPMIVNHYLSENPAGGSEEENWQVTITGLTYNTYETAIAGFSTQSAGTGTGHPRGYINAKLTDSSTVDFWQSDSANNKNYAFQVVEFPTYSAAPGITINTPLNQSYSIPFLISVTMSRASDWCGYSLNGTANVTMTKDNSTEFSATESRPKDGSHNVVFSCNDTAGNMAESPTRYFTIDTNPPIITVNSPLSQSYDTSLTWFEVTLDKDGDWCGYSIDSAANVTMTKSTTTNFYDWKSILDEGYHNLKYSCNSTAGAMGTTPTIAFTTPPLFFDTNWTQSWDSGDFNNTNLISNNETMILANESASAYYTSGNFTSKIFDPSDYSSWNKIIFDVSTSQFPNYDQSASWVDMSGNQLLYHMNEISEQSGTVIDYSCPGCWGGQAGNDGLVYGQTYEGIQYEAPGIVGTSFGWDLQPGFLTICSTYEYCLIDPSLTIDQSVATTNGATFMGWFYPMAVSTSRTVLMSTSGGKNWGISHFNETYRIGDLGGKIDGVWDHHDTNIQVVLNKWVHIAGVWDPTADEVIFYYNGSDTVTYDFDEYDTDSMPFHIGYFILCCSPWDGYTDEITVWNRPLSAQEIEDIRLEQMKGLNISFQARSCDDPACSGESFIGPDGTSGTFFRDSPSSLGSIISNNKYFQYRAFFSTENTSFSPELYNVTIEYEILGLVETIQSPQNRTYNSNRTEFNISLSSTGSSCKYNLDGAPYNVTMTLESGTMFSGINTSMTEGSHNVIFHCNNTAGIWNSSKTRYFTIDLTYPTLTIFSPPTTTADGTPILNATFGEVVDTAWYYIDGDGPEGTTNSVTNLTLNLDYLLPGQHNVTVFINDSANNINSSDKIFTVDITPPTITIQSPLNDTYNNSIVWYNVTLNEEGDWCGYSLDGAADITLTNSSGNWWYKNTATMTETSHNVVFSCNDTAGNMNSSDIRYFTVNFYGGPNCGASTCHADSGHPNHINFTAISLGVHSTLNQDAVNTTELTQGNVTKACWACHGDGTQPVEHPPNFKNPFLCLDCHTEKTGGIDAQGLGNYSAPAVYEHYNNTNGSSITTYSGSQVSICHIPPGDPLNPQTITVSAVAVPTHLAHGDYLGVCLTPDIKTNAQCWDCHNKSVLVSNDDSIPNDKANVSHYGDNTNLRPGGNKTNDCTTCHKNTTIAQLWNVRPNDWGLYTVKHPAMGDTNSTCVYCHNTSTITTFHDEPLYKYPYPDVHYSFDWEGDDHNESGLTGEMESCCACHKNCFEQPMVTKICEDCHVINSTIGVQNGPYTYGINLTSNILDLIPTVYNHIGASNYYTSITINVNVSNRVGGGKPSTCYDYNTINGSGVCHGVSYHNRSLAANYSAHSKGEPAMGGTYAPFMWQDTIDNLPNTTNCLLCHNMSNATHRASWGNPPQVTPANMFEAVTSEDCYQCHVTTQVKPKNYHVEEMGIANCRYCHFDWLFMNNTRGKPTKWVNETLFNQSVHGNESVIDCDDCHTMWSGHPPPQYRWKWCPDCHVQQTQNPVTNQQRHNITSKPQNYDVGGVNVMDIKDCTTCHNSTIYNYATQTFDMSTETKKCRYCHTFPDKYPDSPY